MLTNLQEGLLERLLVTKVENIRSGLTESSGLKVEFAENVRGTC